MTLEKARSMKRKMEFRGVFSKRFVMEFCRKRVEEGITQEELAKILGVSRSTVKVWEDGKIKRCRPQHIAVIAAFLREGAKKYLKVRENLEKIRIPFQKDVLPEIKAMILPAMNLCAKYPNGMEELFNALQEFCFKCQEREKKSKGHLL